MVAGLCWLPGKYVNVGNSIEVLQQVVSLDVGSTQCWAEEPQSEVGESKEVSETLRGLHPGVQRIHVNQLWTSKHTKSSSHLKHHSFLFLLVRRKFKQVHININSYSVLHTVCLIISFLIGTNKEVQVQTLAPTQPEYCSVQMTRVMLLGVKSDTRLGDMPKASRQSSA